MSKMLKERVFDEVFPPDFSDDCGSIRDDDPDIDLEANEEDDDILSLLRRAG